MTLWSRNNERRANPILPVVTGDVSYKTSKKAFETSAYPVRRTRISWIWLVLGVNIAAAIVFMMFSAYFYIPTTKESSVLETVLHQGEMLPSREEVSILEELVEHQQSVGQQDDTSPFVEVKPPPSTAEVAEEIGKEKPLYHDQFVPPTEDKQQDDKNGPIEVDGDENKVKPTHHELEAPWERERDEANPDAGVKIEFVLDVVAEDVDAMEEDLTVVLPDNEQEDQLLQKIQDQLDVIAARDVVFKEDPLPQQQHQEHPSNNESLEAHRPQRESVEEAPAEDRQEPREDHEVIVKNEILEDQKKQTLARDLILYNQEHLPTDDAPPPQQEQEQEQQQEQPQQEPHNNDHQEQTLDNQHPPNEDNQEPVHKDHEQVVVDDSPPSLEDINNLFVMPGKIEALLKHFPFFQSSDANPLVQDQESTSPVLGDAQTSSPANFEPQGETVSLAQPPPKELPSSMETIQELLAHVTLWLKADAGVQVVDEIECRETGNLCEVTSWTSQVETLTGDRLKFYPDLAASPDMRPILTPHVQNELPVMYFKCPLINPALRLYDYMTLFLVVSPASLLPGDTYKAQKFFGNFPDGQFLLHGGKPGFYSNGQLFESESVLENGEFYLLTYRLQGSLVLRVNGQLQTLVQNGQEPHAITTASMDMASVDARLRFATNGHVSLGNVQESCDLNAFQGRIAELLVYDIPLSDDKLHAVETYLARKWWATPLLLWQTELSQDKVELTLATDPVHDGQVVMQTKPDLLLEPTPPFQAAVDTNGTTTSKSASTMFDPDDNVFEWLPGDELFQKSRHQRPLESQLLAEWQKEVNQRVTAIRNYDLGGDLLRDFIHHRKEELEELRERLFGGRGGGA